MEPKTFDDILTEEYKPEPEEPITPEEETYWKEHVPTPEKHVESYGDEDQNDLIHEIDSSKE